jgi:carboxyl-terminal processing protease
VRVFKRWSRWGPWALLAGALFFPGCAAKAPPHESIDPALATETFDAAWSIIHETHFDPEFNGVDWLALRDELSPRAASAESVEELRDVIEEMITRLGQSHFALIPRETVDGDPRFASEHGGEEANLGDGQIGVELRLVEDGFVVSSVEPEGPAAVAGVRPGWLLDAIGDQRTVDLRERFDEVDDGHGGKVVAVGAALAKMAGRPGTTASLEFLDGSNRAVEVDLERVPPYGERVQLGNLPPFFARISNEEITHDELGIRVGVIQLNVWMSTLSRPFAEAVDRYRGHDGIVIDLRGNPGGVGAMVMGLAGHFIDERISLGTMRLRDQELKFVSNPQRVSPAGKRVRPFDGPLAVLIDEMSASTSEVFAGGVQAVGRARIFGRRSAGMALPALMERLPNQDVLYHAVADFTTPSGIQIEKNGISPDVAVALTRDDLLAERDATVEEALRWIAQQKR